MPKVAIVTGSSSGIGIAIARQFASSQYGVVVNSSSGGTAGPTLASALPDAIYVKADVREVHECSQLVEAAISRWGRLDVLVNNAGVTTRIDHSDIEAVTPEIWNRIINTNLLGTWQMTVAALPELRKAEDGAVINMGSVAGLRAMGSSIPYAVSKAAIGHLTELLAHALGPSVRVNCLAPGLINTPLTHGWQDAQRFIETHAPLKRSGTPEEVAEACVFLASAGYITGEILSIDGGLRL